MFRRREVPNPTSTFASVPVTDLDLYFFQVNPNGTLVGSPGRTATLTTSSTFSTSRWAVFPPETISWMSSPPTVWERRSSRTDWRGRSCLDRRPTLLALMALPMAYIAQRKPPWHQADVRLILE